MGSNGLFVLKQAWNGKGTQLSADAASNATVMGAGSSSVYVPSAVANSNHIEFRFENTALSGDNRGIYNRLKLSGAGSGGESLRTYTTVENVAAGTVHGIHASLNFDATGSVTGQGIASRNTLHIPDDANWTPGTIAALQAEIWSDGDDSDTDGATEVSFLRIINGGNANGIADVDDDAFLLSMQGFTVGSGNVVQADVDETKFSHKARIKIGPTTYYIMLSDS